MVEAECSTSSALTIFGGSDEASMPLRLQLIYCYTVHILSTLGSAAFYSLLGACPETWMLHAQFRFFFLGGRGGQIVISIMISSRHWRGWDTEIALKIIVAKFYRKVGVFFKYLFLVLFSFSTVCCPLKPAKWLLLLLRVQV